jgi:sortase A
VRLPTSNRWFRDDLLLKIGVVMMAFALAFTVAAVVVAIIVRDEPERVVAAEAAAKSPVEPPVRSYPPLEPREKEAMGAQPESEPPRPEPEPWPEPPRPKPEPDRRAKPRPEPQRASESDQQQQTLPVARDDWPAPTEEELQAVNEPRHYQLPPKAIMGLTIEAMDLYNVPVINDDSESALSQSVIHEPETSLPWSETPQGNVFLAGHRLGYHGTWSWLVFYNLDVLEEGDEVVLKDRDGKVYRYRVSEVFVVDPTDVWVMGEVVGRDMVTLQTCTPYPTFEKRLIVRADRV